MFHAEGIGRLVAGAVAATFVLNVVFCYLAVCAFCEDTAP